MEAWVKYWLPTVLLLVAVSTQACFRVLPNGPADTARDDADAARPDARDQSDGDQDGGTASDAPPLLDGDHPPLPDGDAGPHADADPSLPDSTPPTDGDDLADADGPDCVHPVCDVLPQCGCPDGQACHIRPDLARRCEPSGTGRHGDVCANQRDCEPATFCAGTIGMDETSLCRQYCNTDGDCSPLGVGSLCSLTWTVGDEFVAVGCTNDCDLLTGAPCPSTLHCILWQHFLHPDVLVTNCSVPPGSGVQGDSCEDNGLEDCAKGHTCVNDDCRQFCRVGDGSACPGSTSCVSVSGNPEVGGIEYGVCRQP